MGRREKDDASNPQVEGTIQKCRAHRFKGGSRGEEPIGWLPSRKSGQGTGVRADAKAGDQKMSEMNTWTRKKRGKKLMESSKIEGFL